MSDEKILRIKKIFTMRDFEIFGKEHILKIALDSKNEAKSFAVNAGYDLEQDSESWIECDPQPGPVKSFDYLCQYPCFWPITYSYVIWYK